MHENPHSERESPERTPTLGDIEKRRSAALRGHRTRRLNALVKPYDDLDDDVANIVHAIETGELDRNVGRAMLQGYALRKDLQLAKLRAIEIHQRLDEQDVREEFEDLKNMVLESLGLTMHT